MNEFRSSMEYSRSSNSSFNYFSPPPHPPNSTYSFFTQQAIRAGYTSPDPRRQELGPNPRRQGLGSNPLDIQESIQRELEKERIRAEIIAEEIVRRRILEEEVRREMMLERELAMRRDEREFRFGPQLRFEPRVPLLTNFEHRGGGGESGGVDVGVSPHREVVGFRGGGGRGFESERMPFQRDPVVAGSGSSVRLQEIKEAKKSAPQINKDKVIFLAKPSANLTDLKRKATTPPVGDAVEVSKKPKTKDDWSCALCRITATSERGFNEHLQGKKHKSRERGMVALRTGFGTGPLPKMISTNTGKPIKVPGLTSAPIFRKDGKADGESSRAKENSAPVDKLPALTSTPTVGKDGKAEGESSKAKENSAPVQKPPTVDNNTLLKGKKTTVVKKENRGVKTPATGKPKKKFRFFCEMCQVGAHSLKVMNSHKKGKRHLALLEHNKSDAAPGETSAAKGAAKENNAPELATEETKSVLEGRCIQISDATASGEVAALKGAVEENKGPELAAEETKKEQRENE